MGSWEGHEASALEEVEHGKSEKRCDNADMASPVEAVTELNTPITVVFVRGSQRLEHSELDATSITILKHVSRVVGYRCQS